MKKLIAIALTLLLILTLITPASAAANLKWDWLRRWSWCKEGWK